MSLFIMNFETNLLPIMMCDIKIMKNTQKFVIHCDVRSKNT